MDFGVLGPVRVARADGTVVDLGGARQRRLLAALILHLGEVLPTDRLLDIVFEGEPPAGASTTIRSYIARLRQSLGDAEPGADKLITTAPGGYTLRGDAVSIDAEAFAPSIEQARRQLNERDPVGAADTLRRGLAIWRGNAYGEFAFEDWAQPEAARLEELRTVAHEELGDALLACGLANDVVVAARRQIVEHPLRERFRRQHMLALYRAGRQAEALRSFDEHQRDLVEVGLEPSDELTRLAQSIAAHDPALRLDAPAGQPLRGYRLGSVLGEGAHGIVHRAVQPGMGREVAIKTIRGELADDPEFIRRFDSEAQLLANLEHARIVPIYDYWREPGGAYIVMRLLDDNLGAWLDDGPMAVDRVAEIGRQLGDALGVAHRDGVVHGDIKLSNVLVDESSVYLADFGVATLVESAYDGDALSPHSGYESPELLAGERPSPASDQFALAVLLVQLLTGRLPFGTRAITTPHDRPPSIHVHRPLVPADVDEVMRTATAWEPASRYPDVETFVQELEAALLGRTTTEDRDHQPANPYRGLRPFTEADRGVFFGRDAVAEELVDHLARPGVDGRFVVAVGASGSGKSSVVRAGLVPRLRAGAIPGSDGWWIATMVPGSDPFGEFATALRAVATNDPGPRSPEPDREEMSRLLDAALPPGQPVLLVIDQLEELFGPGCDEAERRHFIDGLVEEIRRPDRGFRVAATLRADYLDRPLRYTQFGQLIKDGAVTIVGMSASQLEAAVTEPAAGVGVEIEPALSTQIVADVLDQPGALPMLQFTLTELFERRQGRMLTLESYEALGGVAAAVAHRAEAVFGTLGADDQELARRFFLRLVTVEESRSVTRRRTTRSDVLSVAGGSPDAMEAVIDAFGTSRLLSSDHEPVSREPTVEIAHEALIGHWPRFGRWVDEAGDGLRVLSQLADAARRWEEQGRDESELYRGLRLESALALAEAQPEALNALERDFVAASEDARRAEAEAERVQLERQRRSNRRLRGLLAGTGILLLVALTAGSLAVVQRRRADREAAATRLALAETDVATLISRSWGQSAQDPELSVLLALEAHRRAPGVETEQAVLDALASSGLPNRVVTGSSLELDECGLPPGRSDDLTVQYGNVAGRLTTLEVDTGVELDHGPARDACDLWFGDPESGRVVVGRNDTTRSWVGTLDDPYAVEVDQPIDHVVLEADLGSGIVAVGLRVNGTDAVALHDATTGAPIGSPIEGDGGVLPERPGWLTIDPEGSFVAVSFDDPGTSGGATLHVVDGATGEPIFDPLDTDAALTSMTIDSEALELVAGTADGHVITVDLRDGAVVEDVPVSATDPVHQVMIRPDGFVLARSGRTLDVVDRAAGPVATTAGRGELRPDGTAITGNADGYAVIELDGNALVENSLPVDPSATIRFRAGRAGITNEATGRTEVIDVSSEWRTEHELRAPDGTLFDALAVAPAPDGVWAFATEGVMARWEGDTMVERSELGGRLIAGSGFADEVGVVVALGDGPDDQEAKLVSLEPDVAPRERELLSVPVENATAVHPTLDGGLHVVAHDGTMRTFGPRGELVREPIETGAIGGEVIAMDPATGVLAVDSHAADGGPVLVDPTTGQVDELGGGSVLDLGFARDGQLLVVTDGGGRVRVWDVNRGRWAGVVWEGTGFQPSSASWYDETSDSMWVFTSGALIEVPLDPQRWVERACFIVGRDLTPEEWERHVPGDEPQRSACP